MPTPPKPAKIIEMEGKSHRTKKELAQRKRAEAAILTGCKMRERPEVKENEIAHKEFLRLRKLLGTIEKDDDLYGNVINRYCIIIAECEENRILREKAAADLEKFRGKMDEMVAQEELTWKEALTLEAGKEQRLQKYDQILNAKRKMLSDYEKENVMTIASSLRSIPKATEKKSNPLKEALKNG